MLSLEIYVALILKHNFDPFIHLNKKKNIKKFHASSLSFWIGRIVPVSGWTK